MQWGQLQLERTETSDDAVHYRISGGLSYGAAGAGFVEAIKNDLQAGRREGLDDGGARALVCTVSIAERALRNYRCFGQLFFDHLVKKQR